MSSDQPAMQTFKFMLKVAFFLLKGVYNVLTWVFRYTYRKIQESKNAKKAAAAQSQPE